jgi:hypothetical protein
MDPSLLGEVPCHHRTAHPRVAGGGTASSTEG